MSILAGKNVLIIGDENRQIVELESELKEQRATILKATCGNTTVSDLAGKKIDIIILNHLHDNDPCSALMDTLEGSKFLKEIPIFALVGDDETKIQEALMMGAADYITTREPISSVIKKLKLILGQADNYSAPYIFDVPEDVPDVTTKGKRVFVVEDDSLLRNLLDAKLTSSVFPHEFAVNGEGVIEKIRAYKPDVVILDLMLPIKNGFEILAELKADSALKLLPVIIFSNRDAQEDKQRVFDLGADRFFIKAMTDLSLLIETIEELTA
jgi:DNA-binding response OmpR family regulator